MARCAICDKGVQFGKTVSHTRSHVSNRANRMWKSNIRKVKISVNGNAKRTYVCAQCLKSLRKSETE